MNQIVLLWACLALIVFAGWNLLRLVPAGYGGIYPAERFALSYGIGAGALSLEMLLFYVLGVRVNPFTITAPWIIFFVLSMFRARTRGKGPAREMPPDFAGAKPGYLTHLLIFGISFEIFYAFFRALVRPLESYDAVAIYAIKAKILYIAAQSPSGIFSGAIKLFPHPDYPLNVPLVEALVYLFTGALNDQLVKAVFPLFFVATLLLMYFAVRRLSKPSHALIFTFILASVPQFGAYATNGYLDLPLGFYCFAGALFLFRWIGDTKDTGSLIISAVMMGLAGWTKNEGLMYCVVSSVVILAFTAFDRGTRLGVKAGSILLYSALWVVISMPWLAVKMRHNISNDEILLSNINPANFLRQSYKIWPVLYEFQKQFFGPKKWNIIWPAALFAVIYYRKRALSGVGAYIFLYLCLAVAGYVAFYMISKVDVNFFASKTWSRFLLHFLPVAVYYTAYLIREEPRA